MYLKTTWTYGNRVEVRKYHTARYGEHGEKRGRRQRPTTEAMKDANRRRAEDKLRRLMVANFTDDDIYLTLTYRREERPDAEGAKKILKKFFDALRRVYKKAGAPLKYIIVTEQKTRAIHHHLVLNDPGIRNFNTTIRRLWTHGGYHTEALYPDKDYEKLASYFLKPEKPGGEDDQVQSKRYSCSRNLVQPEKKTEVIRARHWREEEPKVPKALRDQGYIMERCSPPGLVDAWGYPYQAYTMIRYEHKAARGRKHGDREDANPHGGADG